MMKLSRTLVRFAKMARWIERVMARTASRIEALTRNDLEEWPPNDEPYESVLQQSGGFSRSEVFGGDGVIRRGKIS